MQDDGGPMVVNHGGHVAVPRSLHAVTKARRQKSRFGGHWSTDGGSRHGCHPKDVFRQGIHTRKSSVAPINEKQEKSYLSMSLAPPGANSGSHNRQKTATSPACSFSLILFLFALDELRSSQLKRWFHGGIVAESLLLRRQGTPAENSSRSRSPQPQTSVSLLSFPMTTARLIGGGGFLRGSSGRNGGMAVGKFLN
ncbi:hypothetical protein LXL04_016673 [Taraxacum kok-saghyz]